MKRRSFFALLGMAPAAIAGAMALPKRAEAKPLRTGSSPHNGVLPCGAGAGEHSHTFAMDEVPSHSHMPPCCPWQPCKGCFYTAVPVHPGSPNGPMVAVLSCRSGLLHRS